MTIQDMRYDFRRKYEVLDSSQRKRLLGQEIDWLLSEAQKVFVTNIFNRYTQGLSDGQRGLDDIRTIIVPNVELVVTNNIAPFPQDYMFLLKTTVEISKAPCGVKTVRVFLENHDDLHQEDTFTKSSFEWEEVSGEIDKNGILLYSEDFSIEKCYITYIKNPNRVYDATTPYRTPGGTLLDGVQNCELPEHTHSQIVDLAVLIATSEEQINLPSRQFKTSLNQ